MTPPILNTCIADISAEVPELEVLLNRQKHKAVQRTRVETSILFFLDLFQIIYWKTVSFSWHEYVMRQGSSSTVGD